MAILDHRGQPVDTGALKRELVLEELSRSGGARAWAGEHPSVGLTPAKLAGLLRESEDQDPRRYFALAEEMEEKDLHYLSVLGTRKRQVAQLQITVKPASDAKVDVANADLVRSVLERFDEDTLFDMLDAVGKGISLTEIVWQMDAREWLPSHFCWVNPAHIDFDDLTRSEPMLKTVDGKMPLPAYKFVTLQLKAKSGIPVRGGLARAVGWSYLFKNFDIKDWIRFAEAYGQPLRVGKFHAGATEAEKRSLLRSVAALGADAAAIIPQAMAIEFVEAKSQGSAAALYENLAKYLDQQVSKAVLGQTATTDSVTGGLGSGKEHSDVREDIERADAKALARALTICIAQPVVDLNRGPPKLYPIITVGRPDQADVKLMIQAAKDLVPFGMKISQADIRTAVGFKEPEPDDELLIAPAPGASADPRTDPAEPFPTDRPGRILPPGVRSKASRTASPLPYSPYSPLRGPQTLDRDARLALAAMSGGGTDRIDVLVEQLLGETSDAQDAMIRQLRDLVEDPSITSLEELGRRLLTLQPKLTSESLANALGDAMALAALVGRDELATGA